MSRSEEIRPGDYVRSFDCAYRRDLSGRLAFYAEGVVEGVGRYGFPDCDRYQIRVERMIEGGADVPAERRPTYVYPPVNGTPTWTGVTDYVVRIDGSDRCTLRCEGCDNPGTPWRWWHVWYADGGTGRARWCDGCAAIAASGFADGISYAELAEN